MAIEKGRGATLNGDSRRFNLPQREADGDWLDALTDIDGPLARTRTQVTVEHPRTILTRNASPDIGFSQSINAYRGCDQRPNGCAVFRTDKSAAKLLKNQTDSKYHQHGVDSCNRPKIYGIGAFYSV